MENSKKCNILGIEKLGFLIDQNKIISRFNDVGPSAPYMGVRLIFFFLKLI